MRFLIFLIPIFFLSCSKKEKINIEKNIVFEIPNYLESTNKLNEDAFLQFQNPEKELYLMVIKEHKKNFITLFKNKTKKDLTLENFKQSVVNDFLSNFHDFKVINETEINKIKNVEFSLKINYINLNYNLLIFEKDNVYYQMYIWTLENFKEQNKEDIDNIINSIYIFP